MIRNYSGHARSNPHATIFMSWSRIQFARKHGGC